MAWYDNDSLLTKGLGPYLSTIIITAIITLLLPILLHVFLYRVRKPARLPSFLVLGPSGVGKTSLVVDFEARKRIDTHTSQVPFTIETRLPPSSTPRSNRYRSQNDFESRVPKTLLFTDTPGHGKLRHYAFSALTDSLSPPTGVIFVVDAANLGSGSSGLSEAAEYLHDVLLVLQRAHSGAKSSKSREIPFLIAANKADLFTALPAPLARSALESEITKIRHTRARGLAGVETVGKSEGLGSGDSGMQEQDEEEPLGGLAESKFEFKVMEECNVHVEVVGGSAASTDDEGSDLEAWWDWIAAQL